jgi:hypothetical protein
MKTEDKPIKDPKELPAYDDISGLMIFGNLKIKDKETGKLIVNKRF